MAESAGGGGLQDVKNGRQRLEGLDGLNDQMKWTKDYLNGRVKGIFCLLLVFSVAFSWTTGMPSVPKYSITFGAFICLITYLLYKVISSKRQKKIRSEQLHSFRKKKSLTRR
jgi:hypothetical protein